VRAPESAPIDDRPTFLAHALALSALHGPGPWPDQGFPLPDDVPAAGDGPVLPSVVMDGIRSRHSGGRPVIEPIVGEIVETIRVSTTDGIRHLHDLLAGQRAVEVADGFVTEVRSRGLPKDRLRALARRLAEHGSQREAVKLAIALLGACGDERDRDLLLLLGTLEELTLFAVVAIMRTQPNPQRTVYELAQRVKGWGRIHAVQRLKGCDDPDIKAWLLRDGFRNDITDEYLAHLAADTGDLYNALLEPHLDEALLDGAGGILAALAAVGGPAADMRHYRDAVPALHRYAEHAAAAEPTLHRLDDLLAIERFLNGPAEFDWPDGEPERLRKRYGTLLARPVWRGVVHAHLLDPVGEHGFNYALSCADGLGMPVIAPALRLLESDPLNAYVWQTVIRKADEHTIGQVVEAALRLLPLDELGTGPEKSGGWAEKYAPDRAFGALTSGLADHPGAGAELLRVALSNRVTRVRRGALQALTAWPPGRRPAEANDWVAAAAQIEPDDKLRAELNDFA
jgi:hypothetical protein